MLQGKAVYMELGKKLQELRKQKGLTQEELAEILFVSRTAVSKWESGRGYPNIESLKTISKFFGITIDELLSGDELLAIAEEDGIQKEKHLRDTVFGLLDLGCAMFFFLPFFGEKSGEAIKSISLLFLSGVSSYLKIAYFVAVFAMIFAGILTLAFQNCPLEFWNKNKSKISVLLNALALLLFVISLQPYAAVFLFVFLGIKVLMLIKWR